MTRSILAQIKLGFSKFCQYWVRGQSYRGFTPRIVSKSIRRVSLTSRCSNASSETPVTRTGTRARRKFSSWKPKVGKANNRLARCSFDSRLRAFGFDRSAARRARAEAEKIPERCRHVCDDPPLRVSDTGGKVEINMRSLIASWLRCLLLSFLMPR